MVGGLTPECNAVTRRHLTMNSGREGERAGWGVREGEMEGEREIWGVKKEIGRWRDVRWREK